MHMVAAGTVEAKPGFVPMCVLGMHETPWPCWGTLGRVSWGLLSNEEDSTVAAGFTLILPWGPELQCPQGMAGHGHQA